MEHPRFYKPLIAATLLTLGASACSRSNLAAEMTTPPTVKTMDTFRPKVQEPIGDLKDKHGLPVTVNFKGSIHQGKMHVDGHTTDGAVSFERDVSCDPDKAVAVTNTSADFTVFSYTGNKVDLYKTTHYSLEPTTPEIPGQVQFTNETISNKTALNSNVCADGAVSLEDLSQTARDQLSIEAVTMMATTTIEPTN